jgi:4-amino-4-deoxy-L-arabinose transferase-like glycosyltransferase
MNYSGPIWKAVQGTAIALVTWLVLYLTKESLGRTAALIVAAVVLLFFVLAFWARMRLRSGGGSEK